MKKFRVAVWAACGLAACCLGVAGAADLVLDQVLGRYPGAVRTEDERFDFDTLAEGTLIRQAVFVTDDEFLTVRSWYAARMQIGPASTQNVIGSDCSLLTQSDVLWRAGHTVAVVICATPYGTQVVVNEKLEFWH